MCKKLEDGRDPGVDIHRGQMRRKAFVFASQHLSVDKSHWANFSLNDVMTALTFLCIDFPLQPFHTAVRSFFQMCKQSENIITSMCCGFLLNVHTQ